MYQPIYRKFHKGETEVSTKQASDCLGPGVGEELITEAETPLEEIETILYLECACDYTTLPFSKVTNLKHFKTAVVYRKSDNID